VVSAIAGSVPSVVDLLESTVTMIETAQVPATKAAVAPGQRTVERFRGLLPQQTHSVELVEGVLRALPSHGWAAGWIGRRDRALLVLSQFAGLSYPQIAALAAGDLSVSGGIATVRTVGGTTVLRQVDDDLLCGPCALARWVHALDLTVVYPDGRVIAALIARAVPVTSDSPHLCQSNNAITEPARRVALLPPVDQWGHPIRILLEPVRTARAGATGAGARKPTTVPIESGPRALALQQRVEHLLGPAR
jgi:hypothetical protein